MSDSNAILDLDYSRATGGPVFSTTVVNTASGREQRNINRWDPLRVWKVGYDPLKKSDLDTLAAFFEARQGRFQTFLWKRPFGALGTEVRVRFHQDGLRAEIDSGSELSSVELELLEVHPGYADTPPSAFVPDSGVEISNGYAATLSGGPTFSTTIITNATGIERRTVNRPRVRRWEIDYGGLDLAALASLEAFFVARKGKAQTFLFRPPGSATTVKARFDQDEFAGEYLQGQIGVTGSLSIVEVI